jgi:hypothetical protein
MHDNEHRSGSATQDHHLGLDLELGIRAHVAMVSSIRARVRVQIVRVSSSAKQ